MTPTPAEAKAVLNTPTLIMGPSKTGKSSLLATAAEYVYETYGQQTHYVLIDGGGFPMQMEALIRMGIVHLWRARTRTGQGLAFETCQRAAQGWWPRAINPKTGQTETDVRLVPPVQTLYTVSCPNGHVLKKVPFRSLASGGLCPTCKTLVNDQNKQITVEARQTPGFENIGALMIDGITSACAWMMEDLQERSGRNELGGEKGALGTIVSGDIHVGSSNRAMYGSVQTRANALVNHSGGVPNLSIPVIWTGLTTEGSDEGGLTIVGLQTIGQAKTAESGQWFGDCMETAIAERENKRFRRLMLQPYIDQTGRNHLCGVRSYPGQLPPFFEDQEGDGQPFRTVSLKYFYQQRDLALSATLSDYATRYKDAPGVPEGVVMIGGEEPAGETPTAAPTPAPVARPVAPRPTPRPAVARPAPAAAAPAAAAPPSAPPPPAEAPVTPATPEDPPGPPTFGSTPITPGVAAGQPAAPQPVAAPVAPTRPVMATPPPRPRPVGRPAPPTAAVAQSPRPATPATAAAPLTQQAPVAGPSQPPSPAATGPVARPVAPPAPPARGPQAPAPPPGRRPAAPGTQP